MAISLIFIMQALCDAGTQDLDSSQYLYEYALQLYKEGDSADAAHELKKCLMVNPNNCAAKKLLLKISGAGIRLRPFFSAGQGPCPNREIVFEADIPVYYSSYDFIYRWDFGDGTIVQAQAPRVTHTYARGGKYAVNLLVDEPHITSCPYGSQVIEVSINSPPVAETGPNVVCCVNQQASFDGSSSRDPDGDSLSYHWDFGDGAAAKGMTATHTYNSAGKFTVTLAVSDQCATSYASFIARVSDKPTALMEVKPQE